MRSHKRDWLIIIIAPIGFLLLIRYAASLYAALFVIAAMALYISLAAYRHSSHTRELAWSTVTEYGLISLLVVYLYLSII